MIEITKIYCQELQNLELPFSIPSAAGHEVPLSSRHKRVTPDNKEEYVQLALHYRYRIIKLHYILSLFLLLTCFLIFYLCGTNLTINFELTS